jgi:Tfp pilus assembly protein FimT
MVLGLGTPELVVIAIAGLIFMFGAPKVMEWFKAFRSAKEEAKTIVDDKK